MIELHHPNGRSFFLNPDLVERLECGAVTTVVLVDGREVAVREDAEAVAAAMVGFRASVIAAVDRTSPSTGTGLRLVPPGH